MGTEIFSWHFVRPITDIKINDFLTLLPVHCSTFLFLFFVVVGKFCDWHSKCFTTCACFSCVLLSQASLCVKIYYYDFGDKKILSSGKGKEHEKAGNRQKEWGGVTIKYFST